MILGFKLMFPWGEPTYFMEKIWASVGRRDLGMMNSKSGKTIPYLYYPSEGNPEGVKMWTPKLHTIRAGNRWKAGMNMQMAYGVRSKNYEQFNKGIEELRQVVSVQDIEVRWWQIHTKNYGSPG